MITLNQTAGNDNALIWIIEIYLGGTYYRYAVKTGVDFVALSNGSEGVSFDGLQLLKNSLTIVGNNAPADSGGGVGSLGGFSFAVASYGTLGIQDFYPANTTHTTQMIGRLGFIWEGATLTSEITWIVDNCACENFSASAEGIYLEFLQSNELEYTELPPYKVQKSSDDKISYFPYAPDDVIGAPIPIVYGEFNRYTPEYGLTLLAPALLVNRQSFIALAASHKVDATYYDSESVDAMFQWVNNAETYMEITGESTATVNSFAGHTVMILGLTRSIGDYIKGNLFITRKLPGMKTDINDLDYLTDDLSSTYLAVNAGNQAAVRFDNTVNDSEVGILGIASTDVSLRVEWTTNASGETRAIELGFWNEVKPGGAGYSTSVAKDTHNDIGSWKITNLNIGDISADQSDEALPWALREVLGLDFYMKNISGSYGGSTSGGIRIRTAYLEFDNIIVNNTLRRKIRVKGLVKPSITGVGVKFNFKLARR